MAEVNDGSARVDTVDDAFHDADIAVFHAEVGGQGDHAALALRHSLLRVSRRAGESAEKARTNP